MVRAPCCEAKGLKKGPWTLQEDQILVSYVGRYGHHNWRALPKHAGLLRCGKSCRLRWMNYLRPDIKRGNFTREEEDAIIRLHGLLGNKWSAIAAEIPGRTDNEIKNVWHTQLKKRVNPGPTHLEERSSSDLSSCSALTGGESTAEDRVRPPPEELLGMDEDWWSEALSLDSSSSVVGFSEDSSSILSLEGRAEAASEEDDDNFWMRVLMAAEAMPELPSF